MSSRKGFTGQCASQSKSALSHYCPRNGVGDHKTRLGALVLRSKLGADERIRTPDPRFTKALLYP